MDGKLKACESRTRLRDLAENKFGRRGGNLPPGSAPSASIKFEGN